MAVIINNKHMSHITTRGISEPGMAALGFLTGFLISLMVYFVVWLIKRRRLGINRHYSMYFWSSSRSPLYFNFARTFLPRLFFSGSSESVSRRSKSQAHHQINALPHWQLASDLLLVQL
jgi:hypothetical protein